VATHRSHRSGALILKEPGIATQAVENPPLPSDYPLDWTKRRPHRYPLERDTKFVRGQLFSISMTQVLPKLSICIPAYNRAKYLSPLLDSVFSQNYPNLEVVISEDNSPERPQIALIVQSYRQRGHNNICYFENEKTSGFDGNLRLLFARATGDYCVMMGNDDLLCAGALDTIGSLLAQHPEVAVAIRSYAWFYDDPAVLDQTVRYFRETSIFAPGQDTVVTFFRRVGVLAGLVFRRSDAVAVASEKFDGSLYYQVYVAAELLLKAHGLYIAQTIAVCREGKPEFGQSPAEKDKFRPGEYTSNARIAMIRSMLEIAGYMDQTHQCNLGRRVLQDLGNYSYYFLAFQANSAFPLFWNYYRTLGRLGFRRNPLFHLYFWILALFGKENCERGIKFLRTRLKATPRLGDMTSGTSLRKAMASDRANS
jgi:abequosyltransferase